MLTCSTGSREQAWKMEPVGDFREPKSRRCSRLDGGEGHCGVKDGDGKEWLWQALESKQDPYGDSVGGSSLGSGRSSIGEF